MMALINAGRGVLLHSMCRILLSALREEEQILSNKAVFFPSVTAVPNPSKDTF
jgi:hypothetical protein